VSITRSLLFQVAEEQASRHHAEHPAIFGRVPVRVSALLKRLGIAVRVESFLREDGLLERFEGPPTKFAVRIRKGLSHNRGRFVLAHELGHVLLLTEHKDLASRWNLRTREKFASAFARELLLPTALRPALRQQFQSAATVMEFLRLMDQWGIHPVSGIRFAAAHLDWTQDYPKILLKVDHSPNRFTGQDQRLRVVATCFDRDRFYVATNQSFQRISPDESWLSLLRAGSEIELPRITFKLSTRMHSGGLRYKVVDYDCPVTALRLSNSQSENGSYLVLFEPTVARMR
jgi:hypothetical protein